jgi:hypothetical protein
MPFFVLALLFSAFRHARRDPRQPPPAAVDLGRIWDVCLDDIYPFGAWVSGILSGLVAWMIIGSTYGMWGVLLGWIPAAIIGTIAGLLWPLAALAAVIGLIAYINR